MTESYKKYLYLTPYSKARPNLFTDNKCFSQHVPNQHIVLRKPAPFRFQLLLSYKSCNWYFVFVQFWVKSIYFSSRCLVCSQTSRFVFVVLIVFVFFQAYFMVKWPEWITYHTFTRIKVFRAISQAPVVMHRLRCNYFLKMKCLSYRKLLLVEIMKWHL